MALAQGVARTEWFEARDPVGEEQGFGLLKRDGSSRRRLRDAQDAPRAARRGAEISGLAGARTRRPGLRVRVSGRNRRRASRLDARRADGPNDDFWGRRGSDLQPERRDNYAQSRSTPGVDRRPRSRGRSAARAGEAGPGERGQGFPVGRRFLDGQGGPLAARAGRREPGNLPDRPGRHADGSSSRTGSTGVPRARRHQSSGELFSSFTPPSRRVPKKKEYYVRSDRPPCGGGERGA